MVGRWEKKEEGKCEGKKKRREEGAKWYRTKIRYGLAHQNRSLFAGAFLGEHAGGLDRRCTVQTDYYSRMNVSVFGSIENGVSIEISYEARLGEDGNMGLVVVVVSMV